MTMTWKFLFCGLALLLFQLVLGQNDSIVRLQEVVVSDSQLRKFSDAQQVVFLNDSILLKKNVREKHNPFVFFIEK